MIRAEDTVVSNRALNRRRLRARWARAKKVRVRVAARKAVLWTLVLGLVFALAAAAYTSPWFYVRNVRIEGVSRLLPAEIELIRRSAVIPARTPVLRTPVSLLSARLEALPFVRRVEVLKRFPST